MGHLKRLWAYSDRNMGAFIIISVMLFIGLFIGAKVGTYYAYTYYGYSNLTPESSDKFWPIMLMLALYVSMHIVKMVGIVKYRYGDGISETAGVVGSVLGVVFKILVGILKVVFAPILWLVRMNKRMKEKEQRDREIVSKYHSDLRKQHHARTIMAEEIIKNKK